MLFGCKEPPLSEGMSNSFTPLYLTIDPRKGRTRLKLEPKYPDNVRGHPPVIHLFTNNCTTRSDYAVLTTLVWMVTGPREQTIVANLTTASPNAARVTTPDDMANLFQLFVFAFHLPPHTLRRRSLQPTFSPTRNSFCRIKHWSRNRQSQGLR